MSEENKTNIIIVALIVGGVTVLAVCAFVAGNYSNYAITKMVQAGANPLDAKCALGYDDPICVLRALGTQKP